MQLTPLQRYNIDKKLSAVMIKTNNKDISMCEQIAVYSNYFFIVYCTHKLKKRFILITI
jgi:hypothetical protein